MADPLGIKIVRVIDGGAGYTKVETADGQELTLTGDRNWRNNNPGNIEYGPFAKSMGAVGSDGRFAVFPSFDDGVAAQTHLQFQSGKYKDKTIAQAVARYAPKSDNNNTSAYAHRLAAAAGVSTATKLSELTPDQRSAYIAAQHQVEGFKPGTIRDAQGNVIPNDALNAIQSLAPDAQDSQVADAYFKPLPAPSMLIPPPLPRARPQPAPSVMQPPPMAQLDPLLSTGRMNAASRVSGGTNLFRGIPGINDQTSVGSGQATLSPPAPIRPGLGATGGAASLAPPPPPKVTFTGNGFNAQPTPFQQNNAAAVMAGLPFGIGTAAQGLGNIGGFISSLGQAKASPTPPMPATPVPTQSQMQAIRAVPPQYTTKTIMVPKQVPIPTASQGYTATGSIAPRSALDAIRAVGPGAYQAPSQPTYKTIMVPQTTRVPTPTVPVRAPAAFPLSSFNTVNPLSQIGPGIASQFGTSPVGHLFQLFSGEPVSGGLLGMLQNNMPSLPHPSMIPSGPAPGSNFLQAQGINTQGMTAGEQANALRNAMGGSHNGEFH